MINSRLVSKTFNYGPVIFLYYFSISDIDGHFENYFEILSFNIQLIVIYFWVLKKQSLLGNGHIFLAGLINDVMLGFPLGLSSLTFLIVSLIAAYVKNMSVNSSLVSEWFTFFIAIVFSNLISLILLSNFTNTQISFTEMSYNTFFTLLFFPFFWLIFSYYNSLLGNKNV